MATKLSEVTGHTWVSTALSVLRKAPRNSDRSLKDRGMASLASGMLENLREKQWRSAISFAKRIVDRSRSKRNG